MLMKTLEGKRTYPMHYNLIGVAEFKISYKTSHTSCFICQSSKDIFDFLEKIFPVDDREYNESFWIMFLNRRNKVIGYQMVSSGGVAGTVVDPKMIFQAALLSNAASIILSHNHPSGDTKPSDADIKLTKKLSEAGKLLEIIVLDHVIISKTQYYSFADEGMM